MLERLATGIAHKDAGVGQTGPGIVQIPMTCFAEGMKKILTEPFFLKNHYEEGGLKIEEV